MVSDNGINVVLQAFVQKQWDAMTSDVPQAYLKGQEHVSANMISV